WPVMAWIAAAALLFETLPLLKGGVGNVIYFFGWLLYLNLLALPGLFRAQVGMITPGNDLLGVTRLLAALQAAALSLNPTYNGHFNIAGASYGRLPDIVTWDGFTWTTGMVAERMLWVFAAACLVLVTSFFFN